MLHGSVVPDGEGGGTSSVCSELSLHAHLCGFSNLALGAGIIFFLNQKIAA